MKKLFVIGSLLIVSSVAFGQNKSDEQTREKHYDAFRSADIYNVVWRELDINYVDSLDHEKLNEIALNSMLQSLDPYTIYIPEKQEENLKTMTTGIYGGIGALIQKYGDYVVVSEPKYGLPAQKNGIMAGDIILSIDGQSMKDKSNAYVSERLKGIPGTEIKLKLRRYGHNKPIEKSFRREAIHLKSVEYYGVLHDSIGYIALTDFTDHSYNEFKAALTELKSKNIKKLIIDLRNNGGGLVSEAVNIASMFLPRSTTVVTMRGKSLSSDKIYKTPFAPIMPDIPLVVMINENSASASEILAGAFQDLDRAVVVGERSYGKGLVQAIRQMPYGGYLKLTTAKYFLPSGRCIQSIDYADETNVRTKTIPDSLTNKFYTVKGRVVRDKSGITPDVVFDNGKGNYVSYYLFTQNHIFDFATQYFYNHDKIAPPSQFNLSDEEYQQFVDFVKERNFTYKLESEKMLSQLRQMVEDEGYLAKNDTLLKQLADNLKADVERDMNDFRTDIQQLLEGEIVKRYYYQKGFDEFSLRYDTWIEKAVKAF